MCPHLDSIRVFRSFDTYFIGEVHERIEIRICSSINMLKKQMTMTPIVNLERFFHASD